MELLKRFIVFIVLVVILGTGIPSADAVFKPFNYKPYRYDPFEYQYPRTYPPYSNGVYVTKPYVNKTNKYNNNNNYNVNNTSIYKNGTYIDQPYHNIKSKTSNEKYKYGYPGKVPGVFFGTWKVTSTLKSSASNNIFKDENVENWNNFAKKNVLYSENLSTGTTSQVIIRNIQDNVIDFARVVKYGNRRLIESIKIDIRGDYFTGVNEITLETYSNAGAPQVETAAYYLDGERIFLNK